MREGDCSIGGADPGLAGGRRGAGRFRLKFTVNFKDFSSLKHLTVDFKDILQIRGAACAPWIRVWTAG
jgi:hypothetical protein